VVFVVFVVSNVVYTEIECKGGEGERGRGREEASHSNMYNTGKKVHLHLPHPDLDLHSEAVIFRGLAVLGNVSHDLCTASTRLK